MYICSYTFSLQLIHLYVFAKILCNFNRVWASAISSHLAKTASKSVHPLGWNFVHKQSRTDRQTNRHTHTHTHTHTYIQRQTKTKWKYNPSTISWRCKSPILNAYQECTNIITPDIADIEKIDMKVMGIEKLSSFYDLIYKGNQKTNERVAWASTRRGGPSAASVGASQK